MKEGIGSKLSVLAIKFRVFVENLLPVDKLINIRQSTTPIEPGNIKTLIS